MAGYLGSRLDAPYLAPIVQVDEIPFFFFLYQKVQMPPGSILGTLGEGNGRAVFTRWMVGPLYLGRALAPENVIVVYIHGGESGLGGTGTDRYLPQGR